MRWRTKRQDPQAERASVIDVAGLEWSAGAPQPVVMVSEHRAFIAFYGRDDRVGDGEVITAEFVGCTSIKAGFPNDEVLHGHRLWGHGLEFYRVNEVLNSTWIDELRAVESVHDMAPALPFTEERHFVLTFHDSTIEAIARDLVFRASHRSMREAIQSLHEDLVD